jgi:replicative DNA helicase
LELLVFDRELRNVILPQLEPSDYQSLATAEIFTAFIATHATEKEITRETLLEQIGGDENLVDLVQALLNTTSRRGKHDAIDSVLNEAENCVFCLRNMAIANRTLEISREAATAEQEGNAELFNQLTFEQLELEKIRRDLQRRIVDL